MTFKKLLALFTSLTGLNHALANEPMGILHEKEDKSGISLNYFEDTEDYGHVQLIVDNRNMSGIALFCATGVFILYNQEEFDSDMDDEIRILAGTDTCLHPGSVNSLLFAQSYRSTVQNSLTLFNNERFGGGIPLKVTNQTQHDDASLIQFGQIKSFILLGNSGWTVTTRYRMFCIKPGESSEFPVCPVSYTNALVFTEELNWLSVREGCDETDATTTQLSLSYCFNHGSGNLEPISTLSNNETSPLPLEDTEVIAGGEDLRAADADSSQFLDTCDNLDELTMLLRVRLTHDYDSIYQVQFPFNKAYSWRTEILDNVMEIVDICTDEKLVNREFLRYVRELYIYFAEKLVWKEGKGWPSTPLQRVQLVGHETGRCLTHMVEKQWHQEVLKQSTGILKNLSSPYIPDTAINETFRPISGLDVVMEFVWLSINFAGAACHSALEHETDFWMDYMNVAYEMYLRPMSDFWAKPGEVLNYYPILLGGFGKKRQHESFAAAVSEMYKSVSLEKLERPSDVKTT